MLKVLILAPTPPPFGGMTIMVQRYVESDLAGVQLFHIRMALSSDASEIGVFRLAKIVHMFKLIARTVYCRFVDGARILYYVPAGPHRLPMFRDLLILLSTRWLFDKTIFHFHSAGLSELYGQLPSWQQWLFRRAYFNADAAIRLSEFNPEDGRRLNAKRDYVIPYGIDDPCRDWEVARPKEAVGPDNPLRILFVAILYESKGLMVLLEACSKLAGRGVPFQLEVVGHWQKQEFADRVHDRIRELKLGKRVRFLGTLIGDEKFAAYRRADVFCFPTYFECESFGLVLLEAMANGLPVVATRWRGIPSVVDEGQTGYLVETHDAEAVADRLACLAQNPELREHMGVAGRKRFEREFRISRHLDRMREVMLEVAEVEHAPVREIPNAVAAT